MKTLEVRRHSYRKQGGGSQLSQAGVDYARQLGATMGPFAYVATSVSPRARETAIAMGFAVDQEIVTLASEEAIYDETGSRMWWQALQPFVALAEVVATNHAAWGAPFGYCEGARLIFAGEPARFTAVELLRN